MLNKYRPDIDGLRAVAVIPVVFYHLGISLVPGGYVGVDIFFVISGYLITQVISAEIHAGSYSISNFYVRRVRRIFPALFFMCTAYLIFALFIYLPNEVDAYRRSLIATTLFFSNIYFFLTQNYFAPDAITKPLLHTWSLSVEEQFYILFPILLVAVRRYFASREVLIFVALAAASLVTSAWLVWSDPIAAFFLPQSRAWELLLGSLLAIDALPAIRKQATRETLGALGLLLIAVGVFFYNGDTPFPGLAALAPCVGAAFIIHSGAHGSSTSSRGLAFKPMRFVGLISYSLYLWHLPIDVIARIFFDPLTRLVKIGAIIVSFALAALSWHFVEKPFRRKPYLLGKRGTLHAAAAAMSVLIVLGLIAYPLSVKVWGLPEDAQRILAVLDYDSKGTMRSGSCFLTSGFNDFALFDQAMCLRTSVTKKNYLLIGDSHAADLWAGLNRVNPDINILQATASGCKPLLNSKGMRRCTELMRFMFDDFLPKHHLDAILLSGRWAPADIGELRSTAKALRSHADRVIVFGPAVEYRHPLPRMVAMGMIKHDVSVVQRDRLVEIEQTDKSFADGFRGSGVQYFSVYQAICPKGVCRVEDDDCTLLEFDYGHFTLNGSIYVAQRVRDSGVL